uniref:MYND-type domain-containing protein n=1 Tax=Chromera velia CCMP2878 TaxID=1169474 RepID=A0A0G4G228_9ALVE|eukprot:Cvel_4066.t1-p1 / transcript=Cvel_4066.t1 / gene=Cvel_4066 / organism=Chromera_velia_CCMP2878 / gene_product=hypothetical protein / transcript_product=hypothetical protein / location=Cvel_scaffold173:58763-59623(+) / protein_length=287 / sequence_SO=supercontig / SO=protein_coding / is_pseudo=false
MTVELNTSTPEAGVRFPWLQINPVSSYAQEDLQSAVVVPVWFTASPEDSQKEICKLLQKKGGWSNPQMLFGYTATSEWKDLYVYFDHGDGKSPVNTVATQAFKMYGLNGNQGTIDWDQIRGPVILCRADPPTFGPAINPFESFAMLMSGRQPPSNSEPRIAPFESKPFPTAEEIVQTLAFFKDKQASAVAQKRDHHRMIKLQEADRAADPQRFPHPASTGAYFGTDVRFASSRKLEKEQHQCASCGVKRFIADLQRCSRCRGVLYCSRACQKVDWKKGHKNVCTEKS